MAELDLRPPIVSQHVLDMFKGNRNTISSALIWISFLLFIVTLCNRADHYIFALWFLFVFLLFLFPRLISAAVD